MIFTEPFPQQLQEGLRLRRMQPCERERLQLDLLRRHLRHAATTPYYRRMLTDGRFAPEDLRSLDDLALLPLTERQDLSRHGREFVADGIAARDICHTSGTTGEPVIVPYTDGDLRRLAYNEAMAFYGAGVRGNDSILLTVTLDRCFVAGLAYYGGATCLGASAIRSGPGQPAQQWKLIEQLRPTVLVGVPSFLLALARWGKAHGFAGKADSLRSIITIGEPVRGADLDLNTLGSLLREAWQVPIHTSYGATEVQTAFGDCTSLCGCHVHPELMLVEIIDENGAAVPDGVAGEVVVTPLGVEGLPLIRFRTGDIARKYAEPCACGWTTPRLGPIEGRLSQRLKCKGTTLYPEMILQTLQEMPGTDDSYIEVRRTYDLADDITVCIGAEAGTLDARAVGELLQARLRVTPRVAIVSVEDAVSMTGKGKRRKPQRFFDLRGTAAREH